MDNASVNIAIHVSWCKRMSVSLDGIEPHCFLSGHLSMAMALETPGPGHETHLDKR